MHAPLLINNLYKKYASFTAVNDVSFSIEPKEIFGLLGPNGAGKSSIISIITSLLEPSSGSVRIFGKTPKEARSCVGVVPQELITHGYFTVYEILSFHSSYYGIKDNRDRIEYLLKRLDLAKKRDSYVKHLSGGMKRRLLIAKALLHSPSLLLLDEPTAGVDVGLRKTLWEFIAELRESENISILLTTHYIEEAENLCDRIAVSQEGNLVKLGKTGCLLHELTKRRVRLELKKSIDKVSHKECVAEDARSLIFEVARDKTIPTLLHEAGIPYEAIKDIHIREGTLEDAVDSLLT